MTAVHAGNLPSGKAAKVAFNYYIDGTADTLITVEGKDQPWLFPAVAPVSIGHTLQAARGKPDVPWRTYLTEQHPGQSPEQMTDVLSALGISQKMLDEKIFVATEIIDTTTQTPYIIFAQLPSARLSQLTLLYPGAGFALTFIVFCIAWVITRSSNIPVLIAYSMAVSFLLVSIFTGIIPDQDMLNIIPKWYLGSINRRSPEAKASIKWGKIFAGGIMALLQLISLILMLAGLK